MELDEFVDRLDRVHRMPSGVAARCPAHSDHVASLSINAGEHGGVVLKCHAGCRTEDVVTALGLSMADLAGTPRLIEEYHYTNEAGDVLYVVERWAPKAFKCRNLPDAAHRVLFNLPAIVWARGNGAVVYFVEGERDVLTLGRWGLVATTTVGGAGKWLPQYADQLAGCHVTVIADNDGPGRQHARGVAIALKGSAASVALMAPSIGKDVTDLIAAGYTLDRLMPLPEYEEVGAFRADRVRVRAVNWAWGGYLPLGKLSMIEGDPGDGKSLLTLDLAARWSTGATLPDGSNGAGPWPVVMISAEDDVEDTLVPRLMAAGARLDYVHLITHGTTPEIPFDLLSGLPAVRQLVVQVGARVVILDPLSAFLTDQTDSHNDHSVRRALQPLKVLAEQTGAAVVAVRHLNKGGAGTKALYRSSGSIGFVGASRASFVVGPDPEDDAGRVLACVKTNLARKPQSLRYEIQATEGGVPYVRWKGPAGLSAQTVLDGPMRELSAQSEDLSSRRKQRNLAGEWLLEVLDEPKTWAEIMEMAKEDGFTGRTLERARADVGLVKITGAQGQASVVWSRPTAFGDRHSPHLAIPPEKLVVSLETENRGEMAERADSPSQNVTSDLSEVDRETDLATRPGVCDICGATEAISRYAEPWWAVRCKAHSPFFYGGGQ